MACLDSLTKAEELAVINCRLTRCLTKAPAEIADRGAPLDAAGSDMSSWAMMPRSGIAWAGRPLNQRTAFPVSSLKAAIVASSGRASASWRVSKT
jgi:hypothetical protein